MTAKSESKMVLSAIE